LTEETTPDPAPAPAPPSSPDATPARQSGGRRPVLIIGAIVVFLAVVLFAVRNNVSADDLEVGTCFNIPDGTTVQTVERQPCTESHNGEVFFVGDHQGTSFPIALSLDSYIDDNCVPAFETYIGTAIADVTDLTIGYFHPSREGWDGGDRRITCYVARSNQAPMTESLKGSGAR
jgi:hypothetical protein